MLRNVIICVEVGYRATRLIMYLISGFRHQEIV